MTNLLCSDQIRHLWHTKGGSSTGLPGSIMTFLLWFCPTKILLWTSTRSIKHLIHSYRNKYNTHVVNGSLVVSIRNDAQQLKPLKCIFSSTGLMQKGGNEILSFLYYSVTPNLFFLAFLFLLVRVQVV